MPPREGRKRLDRAIRSALGAKADRIKTFPGLLGAYINGVPTVRVNNRMDFVWVRLRGGTSEVIQAFNDKVGLHWDLPVLVYRDPDAPDMWRVYGRDIAQYKDWLGASYLPPHADSHSFAQAPRTGSDVVWTFKRQFMPMLPRPIATGSMAVFVESDFWFYGGAYHWWPGSGIAISNAHRPTGAITARFVTVYMDGPTEGLMLLDGPEFPAWTPPTDPGDFIALPAPPTGIPIAAVFLTTGTTFIGWGEIYDLRLPVAAQLGTGVVGGGGGGSGGSGTIVLYDEGVLLGSVEELDFVGAGVTAAIGGVRGTITIPGGGGGGGGAGDCSYVRAASAESVSGISGTFWRVPDQIFQTGSLALGINGVWQEPVVDYQEQYAASGTFVLTDIPPTGSFLTVIYGVACGSAATGAAAAGAEQIGLFFTEDGVPLGTGTRLDSGYGLDLSISGTTVRIQVAPPISGSVVLSDEGSILGSAPRLDFVGPGVSASLAGGVGTVSIPGPGVDQIGIFATDDGTPLGTGTRLESGYGIDASLSGTVLQIQVETPVTGTVVVRDEGVMQGSAPVFDFVGAGVTAAVAGGIATVTIPGGAGGGGGGAGLMFWDDGVPDATGTVLDAGYGLKVDVSGTVARMDVEPPVTGTIVLMDEGLILGSVQELDFVGAGVDATISGSRAQISIPGGGGGSGSGTIVASDQFNLLGSFPEIKTIGRQTGHLAATGTTLFHEASWIADRHTSTGTQYDDEFESPNNTLDPKWTITGSAIVAGSPLLTIDQEWPSHLHANLRSGTSSFIMMQDFGLAASASGTFSVTACFVHAVDAAGDHCVLEVRSPTGSDSYRLTYIANSATVIQVRLDRTIGGVDGFVVIVMVVHRMGRIYLHMQRSADRTWTFAWSDNGLSYHSIGAVQTQAFTTLNRLRVYGIVAPAASAPMARQFGIDWIRVNHLFLPWG